MTTSGSSLTNVLRGHGISWSLNGQFRWGLCRVLRFLRHCLFRDAWEMTGRHASGESLQSIHPTEDPQSNVVAATLLRCLGEPCLHSPILPPFSARHIPCGEDQCPPVFFLYTKKTARYRPAFVCPKELFFPSDVTGSQEVQHFHPDHLLNRLHRLASIHDQPAIRLLPGQV